MTPNDLRTWRKAQHLTMAQAAHLFGVGHGTWTHWERGDRAIPEIASRLLMLVDDAEVGFLVRQKVEALSQQGANNL